MEQSRWQIVKPIVMQVIGYVFLVLGVIGLVVPILQGFLFICIGLLILARYASWAARLVDGLRARHPRIDRGVANADRVARRWQALAILWFRKVSRAVWWPRPARSRCPPPRDR